MIEIAIHYGTLISKYLLKAMPTKRNKERTAIKTLSKQPTPAH